MTTTFYLATQNNFGNRGCEAIVRSTVEALQSAFGVVRVLVPSADRVRDQAQWPESANAGVQFVDAPPMPYLLGKWGAACARLPWLETLPAPKCHLPTATVSDLRQADIVLSTGGDNYSLDYGLANLNFCLGIADTAMALGKSTVLWGASIGPFTDSPTCEQNVAEHLRRLTMITVRESNSSAYLRSLGLVDNVLEVSDPAFAMSPQPVDKGRWWPAERGEGVLGLNVGALIDRLWRRAGNNSGVIGELVAFVRSVLEQTRLAVLLVPHVAPLDGSTKNNDEAFNGMLMQELGGPTPRLARVPSGLNAPQLKHAIACCRFLIGARTHATIAGFSTAVPTLSIAYSVKAKGINRDLFGDERYLVDVPGLSHRTLWRGLELLRRDEASIRELYTRVLPQWHERAQVGARRLANLLGTGTVHAVRPSGH